MLEVNQWLEYRHRRGSLNVGRRVEQTGANITAFTTNFKISIEGSDKYIEPLTLMPHEDDVVETFEDSIK